MDLALNNLQRLICHKTQQTKPNQTNLFQYQTTNYMLPLQRNFSWVEQIFPSLPRFCALLEGFFRDVSQPCYYGLLNGFPAFEIGPVDNPLELLGKEKSAWSKICQIGRLLQFGHIPLCQELPVIQDIVNRWTVMVKQL